MIRKLIEQAVSVAGLRVIGTGLSVAVSIVIARLYGADALGIYAYCVALMALAAVPVSNGWATLLLRRVASDRAIAADARAMIKTGQFGAILLVALAATIALAAITFSQSAIARAIQPVAFTIIGLLAIVSLSDQISALRMATIRGMDRPALAQIPETLIRPMVLIGGIAAGWFFYRATEQTDRLTLLFSALAAGAVIAALVGQIILTRIASKQQSASEPVSETRTEWIASAGALAGSAGLVQLNGYIDLLLLGAFVPAEEIGLYRAALQIAMLASFGYIALNMLAGQRFARLRKTGDREGLAKTATYLARLALLCAVPIPIVLTAAGTLVFSLLFGTDFAAAATPALIIACGFAFSASIGMARTLLVMHQKEFLVMRTTLAALLANIVLCLILVPQLGITGAAIGNFGAMVLWNLLLWFLARKQTGLDTSVIGMGAHSPSGASQEMS